MLRARICALLTGIGLMLAATSTYAGEAELTMDSRFGVDTNVLQRVTAPESERDPNPTTQAGYFELSPRVEIHDDDADNFKYLARYRGTRQQFISRRRLTGWDHSADANVLWQPTPVDTIRVGGRFTDQRRLRFALDDAVSGAPTDPDPFVLRDSDQQRIRSSQGRFSLTRNFDAVRSLTLSYSFDDIDFVPNAGSSIGITIDTRSHTISLSPRYVLDALTSVGFGVTGRFRENRGIESLGQNNSDVMVGDVSLQFSRQISSTASLDVSAGPSIIRTESESVGGTAKNEERDLSWFAAINFSKRWQKTNLSLNYSRFESSSGGAGASSTVDQVRLNLDHKLQRRLTLKGLAIWSLREQLLENSQFFIFPDTRTNRVQLVGSMQYRVTERFALSGQLQYRWQHEAREALRHIRISKFIAFVGFSYTFEPIEF